MLTLGTQQKNLLTFAVRGLVNLFQGLSFRVGTIRGKMRIVDSRFIDVGKKRIAIQ